MTKTGEKEGEPTEGETETECMTKEEATSFRGVAARINYLAADCPKIQFPTKEVCRDMANHTFRSHEKMKRLARYMLNFGDTVFEYSWQEEDVMTLKVFTDSDWAGCTKSRRSTSGGIMQMGTHTLKTWSNTQPTVALSSAEAEYYAMVEGATRGIGLKTMLAEMGVQVGVLVMATGSSAAKSFASQRGLKKMRHIEAKELWLQEAVCRGKIRLLKINGVKKPSDIFTKYLPHEDIVKHLRRLGISIVPHGINPPAANAAVEGEC